MSTPDVDPEPPSPGDTTYAVAVDDGVGAPQIVTVQAANPVELDQKLAHVDATLGTVTAVDEGGEARIMDVDPSDDPRFGTVQHVALEQMQFDDAWLAGHDGSDVVVAVVDTGIQGDHPDLAANLLDGVDYVGSGGGTCVDQHGHGTHVAGIASQVDNEIGGIGGAPETKVLPVRVLDANGTGDWVDVANGISWAVTNGADVINLSLGGAGEGNNQTVVNEAIQAAADAGVIVVAAAGNCGSSPSAGCGSANTPVYPAAADVAIAVGALSTGTLERAAFSNSDPYVDIAAPGTSIDSTKPASTYGTFSGTSMSTPFVSAVVALILQACQGETHASVLNKLQASATVAATGFAETELLVDAAAAAAAACSP